MRFARLILPTGVAVVAASAIAVAAGSSGDTVNGCVVTAGKHKGDLRVLAGSAKCGKSETAISWSKTGPQGAPGPKGDAGPKGETGPAGPQGPSSPAEALVLGGRALTDASVDAYIKYDGIAGESTATGYEGQSEIKSFSFALDTEITGTPGSGRGVTTVGDFAITKLVDRSSPVVAKKEVQGVHLANVVISCVRQTQWGPRQFMTVTLNEAYFTHWQLGGEKEPATLERVHLGAKQYTIGYRPIDAQGGLGAEVKFSHNLATTEVT